MRKKVKNQKMKIFYYTVMMKMKKKLKMIQALVTMIKIIMMKILIYLKKIYQIVMINMKNFLEMYFVINLAFKEMKYEIKNN